MIICHIKLSLYHLNMKMEHYLEHFGGIQVYLQ